MPTWCTKIYKMAYTVVYVDKFVYICASSGHGNTHCYRSGMKPVWNRYETTTRFRLRKRRKRTWNQRNTKRDLRKPMQDQWAPEGSQITWNKKAEKQRQRDCNNEAPMNRENKHRQRNMSKDPKQKRRTKRQKQITKTKTQKQGNGTKTKGTPLKN